MPSIGQTWVLAYIGAVVEIGILSTLKRLPMESMIEYAEKSSDSSIKGRCDCDLGVHAENL
jgi:hypothetical protein